MTKLSDLRVKKETIAAISIKEELNRLFYNKPKYEEELAMLKHMWDQEEEERMGLHASSITKTGNFCYKEQLIQILYRHYKVKVGKVPKPIFSAFQFLNQKNFSNPIHLARIYEQGKIMGYKWQMLFIRAGIGQKEDMDVSRWEDDYDLSYTPDAGITLNGKYYVVELKSQKSTIYDKDKSHPGGIRQLKLYMYFEMMKRKVDGGFVLVDNKDTQDFKVLYISASSINESDPDIATYIERLEKLQRMKKYALKKKKLPKCPCKKCSPKE